MARSVLDLAKIAEQLKQKGVELKVLDQSIDTSEGKLMFHMLGAFADFKMTSAGSASKMALLNPRRKA